MVQAHVHTPLTEELMAQINAVLGFADWQQFLDPDDGDMVRQERACLAYIGPDPDLQGAYLSCRSNMYGFQSKYHWQGSTKDQRFNPYQELGRESWGAYCTSINVSPTKTPTQIARELERRLLPHFLPAYRTAQQQYRQHCARVDADNAVATELGTLLGVKPRLKEHGRSDEATLYIPSGPTLRIAYGSVRIEHFSMTPAQAKELVTLFQSWQTQAQAA
jgi:hypothetical protein